MPVISIVDKNQTIEQSEVRLNLPKDWWSVSYSYSFYGNDDFSVARIVPLRVENSKVSSRKNKKEILPTPSDWDFSKGDYRMQDNGTEGKDASYNNRLRIKIVKYAVYPALMFALLLTFIILRALTNF